MIKYYLIIEKIRHQIKNQKYMLYIYKIVGIIKKGIRNLTFISLHQSHGVRLFVVLAYFVEYMSWVQPTI